MTAKKGKEYKGILLMPGSQALEFFEKGEFKKLDLLIKEINQKEKDLMERYTKGV